MDNKKLTWDDEQKLFDIYVEDDNNIHKNVIGSFILDEAEYVYDYNKEVGKYQLTKKPEESKLPEEVDMVGVLHVLDTHEVKIVVVREDKQFFRYNFVPQQPTKVEVAKEESAGEETPGDA